MEQSQTTSNKNSLSIKFDYWTEEILQLMPLDVNSLVFSGDLLVKSYLNSTQTESKLIDDNEFEYIDLYLFGPVDNKIKIMEKIINILQIIFEQHIIAGASGSGVIHIIIQGVPRMVRLFNIKSSNPSDMFNSNPFAHSVMYWSNQGLYLSPFAKYSLNTNQVLPNPDARFRAGLHELKAVKELGFGISSYIAEFPMINIYRPKLNTRGLSEIKNFYTKQKNLEFRDDVFKLINFCNLHQISLYNYEFLNNIVYVLPNGKNENFLEYSSSDCFDIYYGENPHNASFIKGIFNFENLNKIIMDVHVEDCYKYGSTYFYFLSITNSDVAEKFKEMVQFCLHDLENPRSCIIDSKALNLNEKNIFNVENSLPVISDVSLGIKDCAIKCSNLNKLCFMAIYDKEIYVEQDVSILFTLYNLKKFYDDNYNDEQVKKYEKAFVEIYSVL
jgi:hypothetical protein